METKDGIKITSRGLFLPTKYFRHMAQRLEVIVSAGEIVIRSLTKRTARDLRRRKREKGQRTKTTVVF
ncbi:MAG: hypothetical protein ACREP5_09960 [Candidatus Binatia bacterium]